MSIGTAAVKISHKARSRLAGKKTASPFAIAVGVSDLEIMEKAAIKTTDRVGVAFELGVNLCEVLFQPKSNHP